MSHQRRHGETSGEQLTNNEITLEVENGFGIAGRPVADTRELLGILRVDVEAEDRPAHKLDPLVGRDHTAKDGLVRCTCQAHGRPHGHRQLVQRHVDEVPAGVDVESCRSQNRASGGELALVHAWKESTNAVGEDAL
jgi:hypothetical protein